MNKNSFLKGIALSTVVGTLLGSSAYAGKIITDADLNNIDVTENKQFGFGGWNFDNVDVRIVNVTDFSTATLGTFDTSTGVYTGMGPEMSFESDIWNADRTVIMGHLHGKDWPVGEPAGIKIINDDLKVKAPKPVNCIMTTSYLSIDDNPAGVNGYLDGSTPAPTLCSSDFQTHKRFKVNLLPSTVEVVDAEGYGLPVDLVFNLDGTDTNTTVRPYEVLQKINNYTDKRLDGYKIEVLTSAGAKIPELTLSLDEAVWPKEEDLSNFSHGLWGPYEVDKKDDTVKFENGFFDYRTTYYPVVLSDDNHTISYVGDLQGGNYQQIFGNWLPSIWAPLGIFHDEDANPDTDGILKAFYGVAPGQTELGWWKSTITDSNLTDTIPPVYTWTQIAEADLANITGELYERSPIEDVLNLGVNYIINVGENAKIGSTFILRVTPHVAADQTKPIYVPEDSIDPIDPTVPTEPTNPTVPTGSSDGGNCTFNPNSKSVDMTILLMLAMGMFYPFRRRFIK